MKKNFKRAVLFAAVFIFGFAVSAQEWNGVKSRTAAISKGTLVSSSIDETVLNFDFEGYYSAKVLTSKGEALMLSGDKMSPNFDAGLPDLPSSTVSVIIPETGKMSLEIVRADYYDVENVLVAPSKGMISRTVNPDDVPYTFGDVYGVNAFYPENIASISEPFILRDFRGATVRFNPLVYNPVTKVLRVYTNVEVKIKSIGGVGENELLSGKTYGAKGRLDSDFQSIYESQFVNFSKPRYTAIEEEGSMLVICYDDFYDAMLPFVTWKNEKGISTEMVKLSDVGGTTSLIKDYIKEYYETNGNKYVLLVGDSDQIPSPTANGGLSDPSYAQIVGNDTYVDVLIGRFSAQTLDHVNTYVTKVLNYEKAPFTEKDWFSTGIGVASREGPGHFGEYDYQHIRKIRGKLLAYNYYEVAELYEGSQGGEDLPSNPTAQMFADKINAGASIINYIGHGDWDQSVTTGFNIKDAKALTNYNMYPFIWAVACINGEFNRDECYAEAWTRNSKDGKPIGAIGFMGSSVNQPWVPPMYGQDEMNDILTEAYQNNIKRSFGGLSFNGVYKMIEILGVGATETANTWNCFGDPSVIVRTAQPSMITAELPGMLPVGTKVLNIDWTNMNCDVEGAVVCASVDGKIVAKGNVVGGVVTLDVSSIVKPSTVKVTISRYNSIPFQKSISFEIVNEAFLNIDSYSIDDDEAGGNNDGVLNVGEAAKVKMSITNIGGAACANATVQLTSTNKTIEILTATATITNLASGATIDLSDIKIKALKSLLDGQPIALKATITSGSETWETDLYITPKAAKLSIVGVKLENANKRSQLNAGETGLVKVTVVNNGSFKAVNIDARLLATDKMVVVGKDVVNQPELDVNSEFTFVYTVRLAEDCEHLYTPELMLNYLGDNYEGTNKAKVVFAKKDALVINNAKNDVSADKIQETIKSLGYVCDKTSVFDEVEIAQYRALFVVVGIGTNSVAIKDTDGDILAAFLENGGSIYMEGGDTWSYHKQTAVHKMFGIVKGLDGFDDLSVIKSGVNAVCDKEMSFQYVGENKFIDRFTSTAPAFTLFENENPGYITGVANKVDGYATIGVSFAFAGLKDGMGINTVTELMKRYIKFFDLELVPSVGVNVVNEDNITLYPNPVKGKINISGEYNGLMIFDLSGRLVLQSSSNGTQVDVTALPKGVYVVKLLTNDGDVAKKIIVE